MRQNIVTGIDVGTYETRVVVTELSKDSGVPRIIGTGSAESKGMRSGYVVNVGEVIKTIRTALSAAEEESGVRIRSVFLSVGGIGLESIIGQGSIMISRADNEVTDLDMDNVVATAEEKADLVNKQVVETIPLLYKLDGKETYGRPVGMKGTKLEVKTLFITCLEQHLNDLVYAAEESGVDVEDVIPAPIAASLVALTKKQRTVGCLLANIGAETVSIAVFEEDIPVSLEVFPIGSTDITNDIALGFQIPLEEAEDMKKGGVQPYERKKLGEIIEARLSDIFELIEAHLKKIDRNGLLPAGIILTGGGAGISTIEDFAKGTLNLPSKIAQSPFDDRETEFQNSFWFVAYGLCIFGFHQSRESRSSQKFKKIKHGVISWFKQLLP